MGLRSQSQPVSRIHRVLATCCAALVFALGLFAASPILHDQLHHHPHASTDDGCAVVLFASGVSSPLGAVYVAPPSTEWRETSHAVADEAFFAVPRYLRQPERGPPELG